MKNKMIDSVQAYIDKVEEYCKQSNEFIGCPTTDTQIALDCLQDVFLGEDWYIEDPLCNAQANTIVLHEILYRYYKPYRKYCKKKRKSGW